jgi:putative transposase
MLNALEAAPVLGLRRACIALGLSRATAHRRRAAVRPHGVGLGKEGGGRRLPHPRALSPVQREALLDALHEPRFMDSSPREVVYTLLDEGVYHGSPRTAYRLLTAQGESGERRLQRSHPPAVKPELCARAPNQVWCWDITRLPTLFKTWLYLYVLMDLFSRFVVGWLISPRESAADGTRLIETAHQDWNIPEGGLIVHQDRGAPMTALSYAQKMAQLVVGLSYSRPRVSNDNPFIESHFRTMKYRPDYPGRFMGMPDSMVWAQRFFTWHNFNHRHQGLGFLTPATVHYGYSESVLQARRATLAAAHARHPERFVKGAPRLPMPPSAVTINSPIPPPKEAPKPIISTPFPTLNSHTNVSQIH